jgi:hypothetical protein
MRNLTNLLHRFASKLGGGQQQVITEPPKMPQNIDQEANEVDKLNARDFLQLHIQEYIALRSEQRTRLDSANKIIHYSAIVIAALTAGLIALYKEVDIDKFNNAFSNVLLLFPIIALPFAFTQQNEEILVRRIGDYFSKIKEKITDSEDSGYWNWENWHDTKVSIILHMTAFFRSGLLIIFSVISVIIYVNKFGWPDSTTRWWLFVVDLLLLFWAVYIAFSMANKRFRKLYLSGD